MFCCQFCIYLETVHKSLDNGSCTYIIHFFKFLGWIRTIPRQFKYSQFSTLEKNDKRKIRYSISSVQFSLSVMSDSLWLHEPQHTRPPCSSPTLRVYSNSCPLSRWCHPTISSSIIPLSSCLQSFPTSGSFQMNQFFASGGQILEFQLQHLSFQWIFRTDFL